MKQLQQFLILSLFTLFLVSCSGAKVSKTQSNADTKSGNISESTNPEDKKTSSTDKKSSKDGSSIQNAIKVKSVPEEYEIVRKLCPNCKMNGQSLISDGNKHYDVLKLTNEKGEEVKYYFDINSFYGKW